MIYLVFPLADLYLGSQSACKYCVQWMLANGILERFPQPKTRWPYQQIKAHSEIFLGSRLQAFSPPALPPSETPKVHVLRTAAKEPRLRSRTFTSPTCTPRENMVTIAMLTLRDGAGQITGFQFLSAQFAAVPWVSWPCGTCPWLETFDLCVGVLLDLMGAWIHRRFRWPNSLKSIMFWSLQQRELDRVGQGWNYHCVSLKCPKRLI